MPLPFTLTAQDQLVCTGASVSKALNLTGGPDVLYLNVGPSLGVPTPPNANPALYGDPGALASVYVSLGGAGVVASPSTSFLVAPNAPARIPLAGTGYTTIACLAQAGQLLNLMYGNE